MQSAAYTTPTIGAARRFPSSTAAAKALGFHKGTLSNVLNGTTKTAVGTDGKRYTGKWDPDLADLEGEEWKEKTKQSGSRLLLSNYGRLQRIYPGHEGTKHYPESSDPKGYLTVRIDGQNKYVHVLVGELFYKGSYPVDWAVWDHEDWDKQNNHIDNLRPVTLKENGVNTKRQRDFYLWSKDSPDDWERCVSQSAAARAYGFARESLNAVLHERANNHGFVPTTIHGYRAAFCDEVDES